MLEDNGKLASDHGAVDRMPQPFGPTENLLNQVESPQSTGVQDAPEAMSFINAAFTACRAVGGGDGVFDNVWMGRLIEVVQPSFSLYYLSHNKPDELKEIARRAEIPFTQASGNNLALFCVKLAARPKDTDQNKVCSEWSTLLRCALMQGITPEGFIAWVGTTTVRKCKATVAQEKRNARADTSKAPLKRSRAQLDDARADEVPGATGEGDAMLASIQMAVLEALTAPGSEAERRERVIASLRSFADSLASDKVPETGSEAAATGEVLADE